MLLLLVVLAWPLLGSAETLFVEWSGEGAVSLLATSNDTVVFQCPAGGLFFLDCRIEAVVSRSSLVPDPQPGSFTLAVAEAGGNVSLAVTMDMVGRSYLMVDPRAANVFYGQLIVGGGSTATIKVAPPTVRLDIAVGTRVVFDCDGCAEDGPAWIAPADSNGQVAPSAGAPFVFGPRAQLFAMTFVSEQRFYYVSPTLSNVRGVITVGEPAGEQLPYRGLDLECRCNFPPCQAAQPCDANVTGPSEAPPYVPPEPTIPPQDLCEGPTSALCPSIVGFTGAAVWGVSAARGSDCGVRAGSVAEPFGSIGKAVCAASPGDLVMVDMAPPATYYEDMLLWDNCTSCVQFQLEDRLSTVIGRATLRNGGTVYLRKSTPEWQAGDINLVWQNVHYFTNLRNSTRRFPMPIVQ